MNPCLNSEIQDKQEFLHQEIQETNERRKQVNAEFDKELGDLNKQYSDNKKLCNHTNADGSSSWRYDGQDPGSGKSEHTCTICYSH